MKYLLVAAKSEDTANKIKSILGNEYSVDFILEKNRTLDKFSEREYDYLIIDIEYLTDENKSIKKSASNFWQVFPDTEIVVLTKPETIGYALNAVKSGVSDYVTIPVVAEELKYVIKRIEERNKILSELSYLRNRIIEADLPLSLKTNSPRMKEVLNNVRSVAQTDSTVLITGETGTGKGLIAKLIHQESKRKDNQFISLHCGAIPDALLESELFGHEKGAFTGAIRRKLGKFEIADKGTVFLDEIGTISISMQIKLLQVLQDKIFYRVGGEESIKSNSRIIAATNSNLSQLAEEEKFRPDLYYRLNVFQIELPPLRERLEDLPVLVDQILRKLSRLVGKEIESVDDEVMSAFYEYEWPGNIRELENLMERACILENTSVLTPKSFPIKLFKEKYRRLVKPFDSSLPLAELRKAEIERIEREYIIHLLSKNNGRINESAKQAGIGVRQLNKLMNFHKLRKEDYKQ
jgi:DNA-binding NtrC family response regulator